MASDVLKRLVTYFEDLLPHKTSDPKLSDANVAPTSEIYVTIPLALMSQEIKKYSGRLAFNCMIFIPTFMTIRELVQTVLVLTTFPSSMDEHMDMFITSAHLYL
jgi:hypothetical protein